MVWWKKAIELDEAQKNSAVAKEGKSHVNFIAEQLGGLFEKKEAKREKKRLKKSAISETDPRQQRAEAELQKIYEHQQENLLRAKGGKLTQLKSKRQRRRQRHKNKIEKERFGSRGLWRGEPIEFFDTDDVDSLILDKIQMEQEIRDLLEPYVKGKNIDIFNKEEITAELKRLMKSAENKKKLEDDLRDYTHHLDFYRRLLSNLEDRKQKTNEAWKGLEKGQKVENKTVRKQMVEFASENLETIAENIPVAGRILGPIAKAYGQIKVTMDAITDAGRNITAGTRRKHSLGRIFGAITGAVVGAVVVGGALAGVGSAVPIIGTAIGGTAGIIAGAVLGFAAGGELGVKAFRSIGKKSKTLQKELDYEMEYTELKRIRRVYGLDEEKVLFMHSYLSNQIRLLGPDKGKSLIKLRKEALEEGRDFSMVKLAVYFIGQEKLLRNGLYDLGMETIANKRDRDILLEERRKLALMESTLDEMENHYNHVFGDILKERETSINDLEALIAEQQVSVNDISLMNQLVRDYLRKEKDSHEENDLNLFKDPRIKEMFLKSEDLEIKLKISPELKDKLYDLYINIAIQEQKLVQISEEEKIDYKISPKSAWEQDMARVTQRLRDNDKKALSIANRRAEMIQERDGLLDILHEFKYPSQVYNKKKTNWVYQNLQKMTIDGIIDTKHDDPIGDLFEQVKDNKGNVVMHKRYVGKKKREVEEVPLTRPKSFRGLQNYGIDEQTQEQDEEERAEFREVMRDKSLRGAKEELSLYDDTFWKFNLGETLEGLMKTETHPDPKVQEAIDDWNELMKRPYLLSLASKLKNAESKEVVGLLNESNLMIHRLQRINAVLKLPPDVIEIKIKALQNINYYLEFAAADAVFERKDLAANLQSPLQELFPYKPHGRVEHLLNEEGELIKKSREEIITHMEENEIVVSSGFQHRVEDVIKDYAIDSNEFLQSAQDQGYSIPMASLMRIVDSMDKLSHYKQALTQDFNFEKSSDFFLEANLLYQYLEDLHVLLGKNEQTEAVEYIKSYQHKLDNLKQVYISIDELQHLRVQSSLAKELKDYQEPSEMDLAMQASSESVEEPRPGEAVSRKSFSFSDALRQVRQEDEEQLVPLNMPKDMEESPEATIAELQDSKGKEELEAAKKTGQQVTESSVAEGVKAAADVQAKLGEVTETKKERSWLRGRISRRNKV